jgi:hypothetical protein
MQINATFIVQIINFALTYVVLSRFLLQPFLILIQKKKAAQQALQAILENKGHEEAMLIRSKNDALASFKEHIKKTYQKPATHSIEFPVFVETTVDESHIKHLVKQAADLVVKKVPRA